MVTAAAIDDSSLQLTFVLFLTVVVITLFTALLTAPQRDEISEFYLGNRAMSPLRNGLAMCGDYLSAATLLGSTGLVALTGYDGLMYLGGTTVAWMTVLLLIAEPLHRTGRFTLGDTIALRLPRRQRSVRLALSVCVLAVATLYLVAQLVGSVALLTQFTGVPSATTRTLCVAVIGTFVILYASLGGMPGATVIQIIKAVMLVVGVLFTAGWVLHHYDWNPNALLTAAADRSGNGARFLEPGLRYGGTVSNKLDFLSLELAIVLGLAALPHVLMRLLAPRGSGVLRSSLLWAIGLVGAICLGAGVLGLGATALVGQDAIVGTDRTGNASVLLLAHELGGSLLTALLTCLAYLTLLAVAVGLTLAAASSLAHDLYGEVIRKGRASETEELAVARLSGAVIGVLGILLALVAWGSNTATLAFLAFAMAASAILPTIIYTLFWRRFSAKGALLSLYGGLGCSVLLVVFSPVVSSTEASIYPDADFAWFPLQNPGIVSIPAGFFLGWLGTLLDKGRPEQSDVHEEFEIRMLVGADD
ncbi:solute symporter family protein [Streptomyces djakartensis]|uniref:Cation acetate symporter n=1 Tax=Streptomyces djakartensis TaxID=68193 RepID=A0ABQ2Z6V2_9ACTN|nr:cation acetate symporter [Streptomyces djakartensis]GGY06983.1 cation acetate symporter [Streptomyces djakartensis]